MRIKFRIPKRLVATLAVAVAVVAVPAALFAWGPDRPTYTGARPADHVTFNSITDNPDVGDERNFVRIKEDTSTSTFQDNVTMQPGKVYEVMVYYHNNAATNLNASGAGIAKDTTLKMEIPGVVKSGVDAAFTGTISASNATPQSVYDEAYGKNATGADIALRYVSGSATVTSNGAVNGAKLPDSLFTTGAKLGYDKLDGTVPGCNQYAGYVTFKVRADQPNFTVKKEVSTDGKTWVKAATANPGDTVSYRVTYQNTGSTQQDNVIARDMLPENVSYVNNSSLIANSKTGGSYKSTVDGIAGSTGYNAGSYQPNGNFYFKFQAKLPSEDKLVCGSNTINNVARVTTTGGYKEDNATVIVNKTCKPEAKYTCDALAVQKLNRTDFKFDTAYSAQNTSYKSTTYVVRDASGNEVYRGPNTTYSTQTVGIYSVQAYVTFTVDGSDKTVTSESCKKSFEVTEQPKVPVYTCDNLAVQTLSRTSFKFSTAYSVTNAILKSVVYVVRDANGAEVYRGTNDTYTQTTPGAYTVEAILTVTANGEDKIVSSDNCKKPFTVTPENTIQACDLSEKTIVTINESDFDSTKYTKDLSKCTDVPMVKVCEIATKTITSVPQTEVNSDRYTTDLSKCETPVTPTPPTPSTPDMPTELPKTGAADVMMKLVGAASVTGAAAYYITSRRNQ